MQDERVLKYVNAVKAAIVKDYEKIPDEWTAQIGQLEDLYAAYIRCADDMKSEPIIVTINAGKTDTPNPKLRLMMELIKSCDGIIKSFGLSPLAKSRIRANVNVADTEDFLDSL